MRVENGVLTEVQKSDLKLLEENPERFWESVTIIGDSAFEDCRSLTKIKIPDGVTSIGKHAFYKCISLASIEIPESVTIIGEEAFSWCNSLTDIKIPESVTIIGEGAFNFCSSLTKIKIPDGVTSIGEATFISCISLISLEIPDGVTSIGEKAFFNCKSLISLEIPNSVTNIGEDALYDCTSLNLLKYKGKEIKNIFRLDVDKLINDEEYFNKIVNISEKLKDLTITVPKISYEEFVKNNPGKKYVPENIVVPIKMPEDFAVYLAESELEKDFSSLTSIYKFICQNYPKLNKNNYNDFLKFANALGCFSLDKKQQKIATDFLISAVSEKKVKENGEIVVKKPYLDINNMHNIFDVVDFEYKQGFDTFVLNNLEELSEIVKESTRFISRVYLSFEEIASASAFKLPKIKEFENYFSANKFIGIKTAEDRALVEAIAPHTDSQKTFDLSKKYLKDAKETNTKRNVLGISIKEEDIFERIEKTKDEIYKTSEEILKEIRETASKKFIYAWLDKPTSETTPENSNYLENFNVAWETQGSCAHMEGAGLGIFLASLYDENVQNLAIYNERRKKVVKATTYFGIDKETGERYMLCNNFSLSNKHSKEDRKLMYNATVRGLAAMATQWNEQNPGNEITKVLVGMGNNRMAEEINEQGKKSKKLYESIDYGIQYGVDGQRFNSDAKESQYVVWDIKNGANYYKAGKEHGRE